MDIGLSRRCVDTSWNKQNQDETAFRRLQKNYGFTIVDGNRSVEDINRDGKKIGGVLADQGQAE